ncbi:unnamed protein product [Parnassius mnemosyne]|uniref:Reverse transcriptase domain-containing protein n=1 Tax=Parnassius mnemosyne TaxID=213953 RepID=A0AAV1M787_9NEOP
MLRGSGGRLGLVYMDDLFIASKTIKEGTEKLEKVLQLLRNAKLTLKLEKCQFFQTQINYLGYKISSEGIRPGKLKIEAVANFPEPKNVHEVRQFVGLSRLPALSQEFFSDCKTVDKPHETFFVRFVNGLDVSWRFGEEERDAFNKLKEKLVSRPLLALYDPTAPVEVHTDTSKLRIGAILMQRHNDAVHPVAYYSRQNSPEEQRFQSYELETLALVTALQKFRVCLLGTNFKAVTDCSAIRNTINKRDLVPRVARWWISMQEYDFTIEYRPGNKMAHVDALSRNPIRTDVHNNENRIDVLFVNNDDWLETIQSSDSELQRIVKILQDPESEHVVEIKNKFYIKKWQAL